MTLHTWYDWLSLAGVAAAGLFLFLFGHKLGVETERNRNTVRAVAMMAVRDAILTRVGR